MNNTNKYDDIINLPHHVSKKHPQMSLHDRSAQFAPFAALVGYDDEIRETARLTSQRIELNEEQKEIINKNLQDIREQISSMPIINVTYFVPDLRKNGGQYVTITSRVKKIDEYKKIIIMEDKTEIPIFDIIDITI